MRYLHILTENLIYKILNKNIRAKKIILKLICINNITMIITNCGLKNKAFIYSNGHRVIIKSTFLHI